MNKSVSNFGDNAERPQKGDYIASAKKGTDTKGKTPTKEKKNIANDPKANKEKQEKKEPHHHADTETDYPQRGDTDPFREESWVY